MTEKQIAVIGPGKVGVTIAMMAKSAGLTVVAIGGRNSERVSLASSLLGRDVHQGSIFEAAGKAEVVLIAVSDDAIESVCTELASSKSLKKGTVVAHFSGALTSEVLRTAKEAGCVVASAHPLRSFAQPGVNAARAGEYWFVEGDEEATVVMESIIGSIGGCVARITKEAKPLYHAASVVACNYLVALLDVSYQLMKETGVDADVARDALMPLVLGTIENISKIGPEKALTGPISRGDKETVSLHLKHISQLKEKTCSEVYRTMGSATVNLALRKGSIAREKAAELLALLNDQKS